MAAPEIRTLPFNFTVATSATLTSGEPAIRGLIPVAIITPSAWTAAAMTFQGSQDNVTFYDIYDENGNEVTIPSASIPTASSRRIALPFRYFVGMMYFRLRSGTGGATVSQGADRVVTVVLRDLL